MRPSEFEPDLRIVPANQSCTCWMKFDDIVNATFLPIDLAKATRATHQKQDAQHIKLIPTFAGTRNLDQAVSMAAVLKLSC